MIATTHVLSLSDTQGYEDGYTSAVGLLTCPNYRMLMDQGQTFVISSLGTPACLSLLCWSYVCAELQTSAFY